MFRPLLAAWIGCFSVHFASALAAIPFGLTNVVPGKTLIFSAPLTPSARGQISASPFSGTTHATGALVVPEDFTPARIWPVLLVSASSGESAIRILRGVTNAALRDGWVVLACDGPRVPMEADDHVWNWAMVSSVWQQVERAWPLSRQWPIACAGFSGGAKRSAFVGAALVRERHQLLGLYMSGCNEDAASVAFQRYQPGEAFKRAAIFLSNGEQDRIAGLPQQETVRQSMLRNGFTRVRTGVFEGGHFLYAEHLAEALRWFYPAAKKRVTRVTSP